MVVRTRLSAVLIPLVLYGVLAGIVTYFVNSAKVGSRGLEAKAELKAQIRAISAELDGARAESADWNRRIALLRSDQVDRDLLEERARVMLGRVHKNDLVVVLPEPGR